MSSAARMFMCGKGAKCSTPNCSRQAVALCEVELRTDEPRACDRPVCGVCRKLSSEGWTMCAVHARVRI